MGLRGFLDRYFRVLAPIFGIIGLFLVLSYLGLVLFEPQQVGELGYAKLLYYILLSAMGEQPFEATSTGGVVVLILIMVCGVFIVIHVLDQVSGNVIEDRFNKFFRRKSWVPRGVSGHVVVLGYGLVSRKVVDELLLLDRRVVVVSPELSLEDGELLKARGVGYVIADPLSSEAGGAEAVLEKACLLEAESAIFTFGRESDNAFLCLTAGEMKSGLRLIALSSDYSENAVHKFEKAGAERILSAQIVGGHLLACAGVKPYSTDFLQDLADSSYGVEIYEDEVTGDCSLVGVSLADSGIKEEVNVTVLGVNGGEGLVFNPPDTTILSEGDVLLAIGLPPEHDAFRKRYW